MIHTRTAIEYRDHPGAVIPPIVGVDARLAAERALDEVLTDSFPASDPPSWNSGIIRPHPADGFATDAVPAHDGNDGERTFLQALVSLFGAAGAALLFVLAILLVGLPIALGVRGLLAAVGWLFGTTIH